MLEIVINKHSSDWACYDVTICLEVLLSVELVTYLISISKSEV